MEEIKMKFRLELTPSFFINIFRMWEKEISWFDKSVEVDKRIFVVKIINDGWAVLLCLTDRFCFPLFYNVNIFNDNIIITIGKEYGKLRDDNYE